VPLAAIELSFTCIAELIEIFVTTAIKQLTNAKTISEGDSSKSTRPKKDRNREVSKPKKSMSEADQVAAKENLRAKGLRNEPRIPNSKLKVATIENIATIDPNTANLPNSSGL
jgi:hypothetical protein